MTSTADSFHVSPHVRSAADGDSLVLLDLRTGKYLAFSATAAAIWRELESGRAPAEIAARIADRFGVPAERAAADVEALLGQLAGAGLVTAGPVAGPCGEDDEPAASSGELAGRGRALAEELFSIPEDRRRRAGRALDVGRALTALLVVDLLMRRRGLARVRELIASHAPGAPGRPADAAAALDVWATVRAVERAAALYFKKVWCLQASAACAWLLRRRDVEAELVLGVRSAPFYAHAWVEIGGRPVNETNHGLLAALTVIDRW